MKCEIKYEDKDVLVVYKPAGIATQSGKVGEADAETELKKYRKTKNEPAEIFVIHRLDKPVSGLLVFAKNKSAAAALNKQLQSDSLNKTYRAVVLGKGPEKQAVEGFIKKDKDVAVFSLDKKDEEYKAAKLTYETVNVVDEDIQIYELEIRIETGRFHQIRCSLAAIGRPILGDRKYGSEESIRVSEERGIRNVALTASSLEFTLPNTKKKVKFEI